MEALENPTEPEGKREREETRHADEDLTPGWVLDFLDEDFPITFKPAQLARENPKYQPLKHPWKSFAFAHPPNSECEAWVRKAAAEQKVDHFSVLFVPAMFNAGYWREVVYACATEIRVLTCPVRLPGKKKQEAQQMAVVVFGPKTEEQTDSPQYPPVFPVEPSNWREGYYKRARNRERFGK